MTSLTSALNAATSSLFVNSRDIDVVSQNIANTDTPGYTRKTLNRSNLAFGGQAAGVAAGGLNRFVPQELLRQFRAQTSVSESLSVEASALSALEVRFGNPSDENSIGALMTELQNAFLEAANEPEDNLLHQQVIQSADRFAQELNQSSDAIQEQRRQAELSIEESVQTINELTADIDQLNQEIILVKAEGGSAADLKDRRDALVNELSEEINISYYEETDGRLVVSLGNGQALIEERAFELRFERSNVTPQAFYDPTAGNFSLLNGIILDIPNGGPDQDVTAAFTDGKLGGNLRLRDETLPQAQAQLDELAANLLVRFGSIRDAGATPPTQSHYELFRDAGDGTGAVPAATASDYADAASAGANGEFDFVAVPLAGMIENQEVGLAGRLVINETFVNEPFRIREGTFFGPAPEGAPDPGTGDPRLLDTDDTILDNVLQTVFGDETTDLSNGALFLLGPGPADFGFRITGVGPNDQISTRLENAATIDDYTNSIIAFQANQLNDLENQLEAEQFITTQVENEVLGLSGVNLDQELARLIELESSYSASTQVISTVRSLFDELLAVVR
ncbi:MAG: flagellar hook-associated protein FlgK [Alphaproteobacteria bacterium]|nr:flagellar hook-associated protein FlgK [Alphaproteobacteria bacterium SS10]